MSQTASRPTRDDQIVLLDIGRLLPNPQNPRGFTSDDDVLDLMRSIKEQRRGFQGFRYTEDLW